MDALLRIKAQVEGTGAVDKMTAGIGRLSTQAQNASAGFRRFAGSMGGLVGGLQMLTPLATGAGLLALAGNSMKAAGNMYELAQRTGLSVEALSRFRKPAAQAGTDIESLAKGMQKLSKGIVAGKGGTVDAMYALGISAETASGQMKTADQILLEVADRFKGMEDGIQKTALAQQLFGKAGAELIPMLNEGGAALSKYKGITTEYAKQADQADDAMIDLQASIGAIGAQLAQVLLPFIIPATEALTGMVNAFRALPGPIQFVIGAVATLAIAWVPLAGALTTTIGLFTALSTLQVGAVIAGWAGAIVPAIATAGAALTGFVAFLTGTVGPALIAFFTGPVGWTVLAVAAVVAMAIAFREPIIAFLKWMGQTMKDGFDAAWKLVKDVTSTTVIWLEDKWKEIGEGFGNYVVKPITDAWNGLAQLLPDAMQTAADAVRSIWDGAVDGIRWAFNSVIGFVQDAVNNLISQMNELLGYFNRLMGGFAGGRMQAGMIPEVDIPRFATGGYVTRPTLAMIGEGGEPEHVVPRSKVVSFSRAVLSGATGASALSGGASMRRTSGGAAAMIRQGGAGSRNITLNTRVDKVVRQDGEDRVTLAQAQTLASDAARQAVAQMDGNLKSPTYRQKLGIR
jgi:phage-related protein